MKNTLQTWLVRERENRDNIGHTFREVAEGLREITFDRRYLDRNFTPKSRDITPIKEIENVPLSVPSKYANILKPCNPYKGTLEEFAYDLKQAIKTHLEKIWPKAPVLFSHSAGYDSRIISLAICELIRENKIKWKGHIRCHQPENEIFYKLMREMGYPITDYSGDESLPAENHYAVGRKAVNGWIPFFLQMNYWRDFVKESEEKEWVMLSGLGGGEIFDYPARGFRLFRNFHHSDNPFINRWLNHFLYNHEYAGQMQAQFNDLILPYFSYEYLTVAARCRPEWVAKGQQVDRAGGGKMDKVRHAILKHFEPDTLGIGYGPGHKYEWGMTAMEKAKIVKRWSATKFRREFNLKQHPGVFKGNKFDAYGACRYGFALLYDEIKK